MKPSVSVRFQSVRVIKIGNYDTKWKMFIKGNVCTETRPGKLELDHGLGFWLFALV